MTAPLASVPVVEEDEQVKAAEAWLRTFARDQDYLATDAVRNGLALLATAHTRAATHSGVMLDLVQSLRTQLEAAQEDSRRLDWMCDLDAEADSGLYVHCGEWCFDGKSYGNDYRAALDAARTPTPPERG